MPIRRSQSAPWVCLRWSLAIPLAAVALAVTLSCGGGTVAPTPPPPPPPPPPPQPTTVSVTPSEVGLTAGDSAQLAAEVRDQNGRVMTGVTVSWSSSDAAIATVTSDGFVRGAGAGAATVSATAGQASGNAEITVSPPARQPTTVSVTPSEVGLAVGDSAQLAVEVLDQNGRAMSGVAVIWSSSDAAIAAVTSAGLVRGAGAGSATVSATAGQASGNAAITVSPALQPTTVSVTPSEVGLAVGDSVQLAAEVRDQNGDAMTGAAVTWSSNNAAIAAVTSAGLVRAASAGTATITATAGQASGNVEVAVSLAPRPTTVSVASSDTSSEVGLAVGDSAQLAVEVRDQNGRIMTGATVSWSSSDVAIAAVTSAGLVRAVGAGTATITATAGQASGNVEVTVSPAPEPTTVSVTPSDVGLAVGESAQLTAEVRDQNGRVMTGAAVIWSSSDAAVATVTSAGLVRAVGAGTATIAATAGQASGSVEVAVSPAPEPTTVSVTPSDVRLVIGNSAQLAAEVRDQNGRVMTGVSVIWSSSNAAVATVTSVGLVRAVGAGTATIVATAGQASGGAAVTVSAPQPTTVSITPSEVGLAVGESAQLAAEVRDQNGQVMTGVTVTWISSNTTAATVTSAGLVRAAAAGTATITATAGQASGTVEVTVSLSPRPTTVSVTPSDVQLVVGESAQLAAAVRDQNRHIMTGATVTWASSSPAIATASSTGRVHGIAAGTATVTATAGSASGSAAVTVSPAPQPTTVSVTPSAVQLVVGNTAQLAAEVRDQHGQVMSGVTVSWTSGNTTAATVTSGGLVSAAAAGTATITATAGSASGSAAVTVSLPPQPTTVSVTPSDVQLTVGESAQLAAEVRDQNSQVMTGATVTWASSSAAIVTASSTGRVHGVAAGTATVTATAGSASGSASVTVSPPPQPTTVSVTPSAVQLVVGDSAQLAAEVRDQNSQVMTGATVSWTSSSAAIATASSTGRVHGVAAGTATITGTAGSASGSASVTVSPPPQPTTVSVTPSDVQLVVGDSAQLAAEVRDQNSQVMTGATVSWTSSSAAIATASSTGRVHGVAAGTATITGTAGSASGSASVTVSPAPVPTTVSVTPSDVQLTIGNTAQLAAEVRDQDDQVITGATVSWTSSNATAATVTSGGLVSGAAAGTATVTATAGSASGSAAVTVSAPSNREALVAFYNALGGSGWTSNTGWLSESPLGDWHGVTTDSDGSVTALDLTNNGLAGTLPSELGYLANLVTLWLADNQLSGSIPTELGNLSNLASLSLGSNQLAGPIPTEIGNLANLTTLWLGNNRLTGSIPTQLGNLANLEYLSLYSNRLTGSIPAELGNLSNLRRLGLDSNRLTGSIPAELGDLSDLTRLWLQDNQLTGSIPTQLGDLSDLQRFVLSENQLSGSIPTQLGSLSDLERLYLHSNRLTGSIPAELGNLSGLVELKLDNNSLEGSVPSEIGSLTKLEKFTVNDNAAMAGELPAALTSLSALTEFNASRTSLCAPRDAAFNTWLSGIATQQVSRCVPTIGSAAYLTQAVQSRSSPVSLVAGEPALLRVFVSASGATGEDMPPVKATFYRNGSQVHVANIAAPSADIPTSLNEGDLSVSANASIPASVVQPGLEMVVEIDPENTLAESLGVIKRIPASGRATVSVQTVRELDFTIVPLLWSARHDSAAVRLTDGLTADDVTLLGSLNTLLPVASIDLKVHAAVVTASNNVPELLGEIVALRTAEGAASDAYYMGMMSGALTGGYVGLAYVPGRASFSVPDAVTIAHELGHNFGLSHAPCGGATDPDPNFPTTDGTIGSWGYDMSGEALVAPTTPDFMGYCDPDWVSGHQFNAALSYRGSQEASGAAAVAAGPERALLLWGGIGESGEPFLEPAFIVDAPPSLPLSPGGEYAVAGRDASGRELFSLSFDMPALSHGDGRSVFAYALPARQEWAGSLASITLSGPGGSFTLDNSSDRAAAIVRDPLTGQIRGIFRDAPPSLMTAAGMAAPLGPEAAAALSLEPSLEVLASRSIPRPEDWRR